MDTARIAYILRATAYALETPGDLNTAERYAIIDDALQLAQSLVPLEEDELI